jgi:AmiR/NasT family two-component response regulator
MLRKEKLAEKSSLVILTNQGQSNEIEKAKKLGFDGYIVKATTIPSEVVSQVLEIHEKKHGAVSA